MPLVQVEQSAPQSPSHAATSVDADTQQKLLSLDFPVAAVVAESEAASDALVMVAPVVEVNMVVANSEAASDALVMVVLAVMVHKSALGAKLSEKLDVSSYHGRSVYSTLLGRKRFLRKMGSA